MPHPEKFTNFRQNNAIAPLNPTVIGVFNAQNHNQFIGADGPHFALWMPGDPYQGADDIRVDPDNHMFHFWDVGQDAKIIFGEVNHLTIPWLVFTPAVEKLGR